MTKDRYIGPTPERLAKAGRQVEPVASETGFKTLRMLDGSVLEALATLGQKAPRKGITGDQYYAGCRYYADHYLAGLQASGVIDPGRVVVDGGGRDENREERRLSAMSRFNAALRAIDRYSRDILSDVVLRDMPLNEYAERFRSFPLARERRAIALQRLRDALDQLDAHYNLPRRERVRTAHAPDYWLIIKPSGQDE